MIAYDADFFEWTQEMAARLRAHDIAALDWENIAEEIESMGRRDYRALLSRMEVLLTHLLKWRFQSERRSRIRAATITEQRGRIGLVIADSPSFRRRIEDDMPKAYRLAVAKAQIETTIYSFPAECPWTFEEAMTSDLSIA